MLEAIKAYLGLSLDQIRSHPDLLINAFDQNHTIVLWNNKCEQYFGVTEAEALGNTLEAVLPFTKGHEKMMHLKRALLGKPVHIISDRYDKARGSYEQLVIPIKNKEGAVVAALNILKTLQAK